MNTGRKGPFDGIRIIDLTAIVFGPLATQIFGDLGADVIKIEPPEGDQFRNAQAARSPRMGAAYINSNRNKRSLCLDLKQPEAHAALMRLIAGADVFVHSLRPQAIAKLGLDYASVKAAREDIVYCSAWGYGSGGPYAGRPAYDDVIQAASGIAGLVARTAPDGVPAFAPMVMADKTGALTVTYAVMAALFHRERTGEGQEVEVPMFESLAAFNLVEHLAGASFEPHEDVMGYVRLMSPSRKPYATKDGYIAVLPYTTRHWRAFFSLAGRPEMLEDHRVNDAVARGRAISELYEIVETIMPERNTGEWLELLTQADIPVAPVNSLEDLLEDPHLRETGFFVEYDHPGEGRMRTTAPPTRFSQSPAGLHRHPPRLGEHSREVLAEAGYDAAQIADLIERGICRE